ncbi:hypothetical protein [Spiroplasma turonicum]|uniref:Mannitol-1-phosphate 5-dehydrogenase n=1 Tax=Spiroplasma turonicum TaxID=216946 RepID=A0A0K1P6V0_9MOLU|nr:hypothetical protein [Spiroplasma turonicum]AKU80023.1 mannitol-1-phosphate 5-dehydrogenase [Spiroplasma turonicum]ALX71025.1 mannitol-1-phosphate 5-dehydrogenase [Spiroplasma turonicum]
MKILHYGAGNIGRGFIAPILFKTGLVEEFYFTDSNAELINKLKNQESYQVIELDENEISTQITNYKAVLVNEIENELNVKDIDIITTSIGSNNLKYIKNQLISFIKIKENANKPLIIMCCENGEKVSTSFEYDLFNDYNFNKKLISFVDVMVDRIVPNDTSNDLNIKVEPYYSWIADEKNWNDNIIKPETITFTNNIDAEICKKVWMLNGSHASISWKEWKLSNFKHKYINNTLNNLEDQTLLNFLESYLSELSKVIEKEFNYDSEKLKEFKLNVIKRFRNKYIKDDFERVARNTIKKIQLDERIFKPFIIANKNNIDCKHVKETIINALSYNNVNDSDGLLIAEMHNKGMTLEEILIKTVDNIDDSLIKIITN